LRIYSSYPILGFFGTDGAHPKFVHGDFGSGLEEAFILLYLLVDDAYRRVTFGGRLEPV
jgi:hypothetical protein